MPSTPDLRPGDPIAIRTATTPKKSWIVAEVVSAGPEGVSVMQDKALMNVGWDVVGPPF